MTTLLPCAVAWVIGGFHILSILPESSSPIITQKHPKTRPPGLSDASSSRDRGPGRVRLSFALRRSFGRPLQRVGDVVAVPVRVGSDEVRVSVDTMLVDVEAVELLVGLDPDADGGLEDCEYHEGRDEDEASRGHDPQGLHPELVEAAAVEEARLADCREFRGGEESGGEGA